MLPEASTSASTRAFRSAIFLSRVRTSRSTSEADRLRRRSEALPRGLMPRRMRAALSAESFPVTPPGILGPARARAGGSAPGCALLPDLRASRKAGAAPPMRPRDLPLRAARYAKRPKRWLGHRARRCFWRCQRSWRAPAPLPKAWEGRPPRTRLPLPVSPPVPEGSKAGANLREGSTSEQLACGLVHRRHGDRTFVGIDPDQDLHGRAPPFLSDLCAIGVREGHSDFGLCFHTSFESLRLPRAPARRKPRTSQPTLCVGDRKFASDPCEKPVP